MIDLLRGAFDDAGMGIRTKIAGIYLIVVALVVVAWGWALSAFHDRPLLLGTAFVAFSFGLRHAVDADHIAAIDNVTRKLMQEGKRPVAVGFFFSLGHSSVVILASLGVVLATAALKDRFNLFEEAGGLIGTSVSALFLVVIAVSNLAIFLSIWRAFRKVRRGEPIVEEELDSILAQRGFLARIFRRLFKLVATSWHMFPLGFLFGLGFDTATEIAVLGISAAEASKGMPIGAIMVFPMLFTAGMSLVDTTDGVLMLGAYGWAFQTPMRKLFYNMTITLVSVLVALIVGSVEALGLFSDHLGLKGLFWGAISSLNDNFGMLGYGIIGVFVASWAGSVALYRMRGFDKTNKLDLKT
ncbi:MAG: HoxN/HupN/NixA family nickel/cobalt transporter [Methylovirgula sp.]